MFTILLWQIPRDRLSKKLKVLSWIEGKYICLVLKIVFTYKTFSKKNIPFKNYYHFVKDLTSNICKRFK